MGRNTARSIMPETVDTCIAGSRFLDRMRADIKAFSGMFLFPAEIDMRPDGWYITTLSPQAHVFLDRQYRAAPLHFRIMARRDGGPTIATTREDQELPRLLVKPLHDALPEILKKLIDLFPEVEARMDFFYHLGSCASVRTSPE